MLILPFDWLYFSLAVQDKRLTILNKSFFLLKEMISENIRSFIGHFDRYILRDKKSINDKFKTSDDLSFYNDISCMLCFWFLSILVFLAKINLSDFVCVTIIFFFKSDF